jgi:hypothetical protein
VASVSARSPYDRALRCRKVLRDVVMVKQGLTRASRPRFRRSIRHKLARRPGSGDSNMVLGINTVVGAVGGVLGKLLPGGRKEATLIDGKKIAATITAEVKADVDQIRAQTGKVRPTPRMHALTHGLMPMLSRESKLMSGERVSVVSGV